MILGYFEPGKSYTTKHLEEITGMRPDKAAWEMQFSIWFINNGFEVKHFSTFDYQAFKQDGMEYIRKTYGEEVANWQIANSDIDSALKLIDEYTKKVKIVHRKPTIKDIVEQMKSGYIVRVGVNSGFLNNTGRYVGHSVVVTGYDASSIWFHDPGLPPMKNRETDHQTFQKAMDSFGSEIDAIKKL